MLISKCMLAIALIMIDMETWADVDLYTKNTYLLAYTGRDYSSYPFSRHLHTSEQVLTSLPPNTHVSTRVKAGSVNRALGAVHTARFYVRRNVGVGW